MAEGRPARRKSSPLARSLLVDGKVPNLGASAFPAGVRSYNDAYELGMVACRFGAGFPGGSRR